ncbi:MAG: DUF29 domain-containing protein [Runella slithyformis]|jgi:hypothetical protein|nr:MAG: DUF29 domain-containing protein [Runella slithyformis]TAF96917.1 MAG: DUF29 domain-containing protein [Runella sp.]TAG21360.1 MAG: DUF29 domain-containing protein [Cytophagales bacterium]TAG40682.1 MAG: DUF29 domain-containing protein [Cytophagia bacterium]TAF29687.1 MAG: DUF29 domain-containing protein [Runella slithyformis]
MEATTMKVNWQELVSESYYETIWAIEEQIRAFDNDEALTGLRYLYENMNKRDKRELKSFVVLLMTHVIKWKEQPQKRSMSWVRTIFNARMEIQEKKEDTPNLSKAFIESIWESCFERATVNAGYEMGISSKELKKFEPTPLTWQEVFEDEYLLEND